MIECKLLDVYAITIQSRDQSSKTIAIQNNDCNICGYTESWIMLMK